MRRSGVEETGMSREGWLARIVFRVLLVALAIFGYIHGIYWAGGIKAGWTGPGCAQDGCMPWQATMIDFAPLILFGVFLVVGGTVLLLCEMDVPQTVARCARAGLARPSLAELRQRQRAERQRRLEADIARLEIELELREQTPVEHFEAAWRDAYRQNRTWLR